MRDDRVALAGRRAARLAFVVGALVGWLVIQNGVLLVIWSWPLWPAIAAVARALVKVGGLLAVPVLAAGLVAGGAVWLWAVYRGTSAARDRHLEEAHHG